ncbi:hypothetical protein XFF6992_390004 [Xanthomonas citri pv. fuscans]|nr:hypothetical protein XFF6992_390004 [Xanthomonas citri pv. fuscans]SOO34109.1 hypothetical protein XFF6994_3540002 [Xanthomonas citri pv. fuscans]
MPRGELGCVPPAPLRAAASATSRNHGVRPDLSAAHDVDTIIGDACGLQASRLVGNARSEGTVTTVISRCASAAGSGTS